MKKKGITETFPLRDSDNVGKIFVCILSRLGKV
jgi:hypothetical protein